MGGEAPRPLPPPSGPSSLERVALSLEREKDGEMERERWRKRAGEGVCGRKRRGRERGRERWRGGQPRPLSPDSRPSLGDHGALVSFNLPTRQTLHTLNPTFSTLPYLSNPTHIDPIRLSPLCIEPLFICHYRCSCYRRTALIRNRHPP